MIKKHLKKLYKHITASLFLIRNQYKVHHKKTDKPIAYAFKFSKWKQPYVAHFFDEYHMIFVPNQYSLKRLNRLLRNQSNYIFLVWGCSEEMAIGEYAAQYKVPLHRVEDGFLRSVGLGAMHTPPYSLCLDKTGIYFDSTRPSDLENLLNHYDFQNNQELLIRAGKIMRKIIDTGLSKYNHLPNKAASHIYGEKNQKRILVIGQVEDDASIKRGSNQQWTNNDLVRLARKENRDAQIIYKPHPDVLTGRRPKQSNPKEVAHLAEIIEQPLSLHDALQTIDHVYTITSLSGFEALIRSIPVTTVGAPFYSNWGLTDDRQKITRRKRTLTIEALFAAAYILYPRYMDPETYEKLTVEEAMERIESHLIKK
ncbi:capsular polysaccharide biosynthesis protein [Cytobacillus horneckiae]|nr:capsular polysaccharide biosynthesis protein [Cytobacillus horneckiae]